jgi:hypothetical protein
VLVDVEGYYASTVTTSGLYNPLSPYRALGTLAIGQGIAQDASQAVTVTGTASGVPSSATAVVVNVTAADATASSFLTVYPAGVSTLPQASNLNFGAQAPLQAIANRATVGVGTGGQIEVYNHTGTVNVDVDVDGYYTGSGGTGSAFVAITPVRLFDTRTATLVGTGTPIAASGIESFSLTNTTIPSNAAAVAANFTVVPGAAPGYLTVYPEADATPPVASDVNWTANESPAVPNYTIADTAGTGSVAVFNGQGATINLLIDAFGYFVSATSPSGPTPPIESANWSGDYVTSGPYTSVTGTFTVPSLVAPIATNSYATEWVGIDGATNTDLIQAGVDEYQSPECASFCVSPWWEILPAESTSIADVTVDAGDQVTVSIDQVSGTTWDITLTDDRNLQTFSTGPVMYTGPDASAEWIVEDPSNGVALYPFADYTTTTFSNLGFTGTENSLTEVVMIQGPTQLSTPSAWTDLASGFAVAYGGVAPPSPP